MSRRNRLFKEMGLGPVWKLRDRPEAAEALPLPPVSGLALSVDPIPQDQSLRATSITNMDWPALITAVAGCRDCTLGATRKQAVLGVGDLQADWLFVGEGPGAEEDERGEPFVGQAGKLLDAMLAAIDLKRGEGVYIANAVKCRPPGNRTPEPDEVAACRSFLVRQIELIRPRLIVALGRPAAQTLLQKEVKITGARGRVYECQGIPVIVTYHPAYLLRKPEDKAKAWEDLVLARRTMAEIKAGA
ncbi:MAG: uracil-DNA glycosylase [Proteobacteria bacterium]|nr:uracil-DNA glycosylase [Pseudomonadota bacterium]HQR02539.1 uracil-DNA glycosylase family protein [Rhodocyclaceae bacterium]